MILRGDLTRRYILDVTADGAVFIRERGQGCTVGALPTFSTDTYDHALMIQIRYCRRANDGSGIYRLNECPADLDALGIVTDMFRAFYDGMSIRKSY